MPINVLLVACGGALGAVGRYGISLIGFHGSFPLLTLLTNLLGALAIGIVVGLVENPKANLFLKTGVCGGFTTFSTFSLETLNLMEGGKSGLGIAYAALSLVLCILGVWLGKSISSYLK